MSEKRTVKSGRVIQITAVGDKVFGLTTKGELVHFYFGEWLVRSREVIPVTVEEQEARKPKGSTRPKPLPVSGGRYE